MCFAEGQLYPDYPPAGGTNERARYQPDPSSFSGEDGSATGSRHRS
jgi:hypothetical protein